MSFKINLKKTLEYIMIFIAIGAFVFLNNFIDISINNDDIWNFHMIQKITLGYIPYKEINIIITPFYHFVGTIFMKVFGTNFITYYFYGSVILATLGVLFYHLLRKITDKVFLHFLGMLFYLIEVLMLYTPNYNTFIMVFLLGLLLIQWKIEERIEKGENNNKLHFFSGIVMAMAFLTKQTIGAIFSLTYIIYCVIYEKNVFKKINLNMLVYKILGILAIALIFIIYLLISGNLIDFIDLCFGGILDFAEKNKTGNFFNWKMLILIGVSIFSFGYFNVKKDDVKMLLLGMFSVTSVLFIYPLINEYHMYLSLIIPSITLIYIINLFANDICEEKNKRKFKYLFNLFGVIIAGGILTTSFDKISNFRFTNVPNNLKQYEGMVINEEEYTKINKIIKYIDEKETEGYEVYVLSPDAGRYMIPLERNNNKFDLLLQGNLGYKGEDKILDEIEKIENPLFLKAEELIFQESKIVDEFIKENYKEIDKIETLIVYTK